MQDVHVARPVMWAADDELVILLTVIIFAKVAGGKRGESHALLASPGTDRAAIPRPELTSRQL